MKKIFFVFLSVIFLSACGLQSSTSLPQPDQESTSSDDQEILEAFDQDKDIDFSSEFKQLDTDLQ